MEFESKLGFITQQPEVYFSKNKIGLDFDGVTSDTYEIVTDGLINIFNIEIIPTDIREWHFVRTAAMARGYSKSGAERVEEYLWYDINYLNTAQPKEGLLDFWKWFKDRDIYLPIVTSRMSKYRASTLEWCFEKLSGFQESQLIMQANAEMPGDIFKAFMINKLGLSSFIEDVPGHAKTILDYTRAQVILLSNSDRSLDFVYPESRLVRVCGNSTFELPTMNQVSRLFNILSTK